MRTRKIIPIQKLYYVRPQPLNHELRLHEVDEHRKFDCIFYELCLDTTSARKFTSFTCKSCVFYVQNKKEMDDTEATQKLMDFIKNNPNDELAQKLKIRLGANYAG